MNLYGIVFVIAGIAVFAYLTGLSEPFSFIREQFRQLVMDIWINDLAVNTAILICLVMGFSRVAWWLFGRRDAEEEGRDRLGNSAFNEAGARRVIQAPREEGDSHGRRA